MVKKMWRKKSRGKKKDAKQAKSVIQKKRRNGFIRKCLQCVSHKNSLMMVLDLDMRNDV